jgi:hypothetical protein
MSLATSSALQSGDDAFLITTLARLAGRSRPRVVLLSRLFKRSKAVKDSDPCTRFRRIASWAMGRSCRESAASSIPIPCNPILRQLARLSARWMLQLERADTTSRRALRISDPLARQCLVAQESIQYPMPAAAASNPSSPSFARQPLQPAWAARTARRATRRRAARDRAA